MSEPFVTVTVSKTITEFRPLIENFRDEVLEETAPILRKAEEASIRARWYRLGRTLRSLKEDVESKGGHRIYKLFPTAPHAAFGEYGTGRRGAVTGRPAPRGWKYGDRSGMEARRYSRLAVVSARPKILQTARGMASRFARNVTVK